ncbi:glycosyltransferase [Robertmurraya massiliosenegalensis]|uniref:glycosyltransferase family protein n=1 Tax=Robertmurraya TaxID=2837507 RepID=UPI0039A7132E
MVKVLYITNDTSTLIVKNFLYLEQALSELTTLKIWRKSGSIQTILKKLQFDPDFILIQNDISNQLIPYIQGLSKISIPVGLIVNDVYRFKEPRRIFIKKNNINYVFSIIRKQFLDIYPEYSNRLKWFPHFIQPEIYKDYQLSKDIDLLLMGSTDNIYPLRQKIVKAYENNPNFIYHPHPGYGDVTNKEKGGYFIGEKYARELNRSKIFFTSPSIYLYPVMKYFEALACKTLLLAPTFEELEALGFKPGTHFIPINESNFKEKATHYLNHDEERKKITEMGYAFVHQNHSLMVRAKQLVEEIEKIVATHKED